MRKDLVKNSEAIALLNGASPVGRGESWKPLPSQPQARSINTERILRNPKELDKIRMYPDFPFLPSFEAIDPVVKALAGAARHQLQLKLSQTSSGNPAARAQRDQALAQWWSLYPRCPSRDEFAVVEQVERFPSQPTGEKFTVVKVDAQGRVVIDEKRFQQALKECSGKVQGHFRDLPLELIEDQTDPKYSLAQQSYQETQDAFFQSARKKISSGSGGSQRGAAHELRVDILGSSRGVGVAAAPGANDLDSHTIDDCIDELEQERRRISP